MRELATRRRLKAGELAPAGRSHESTFVNAIERFSAAHLDSGFKKGPRTGFQRKCGSIPAAVPSGHPN